MYLKKSKRKNGRINLSIFKSYRDPITKRVRTKSIKNLGYLDELEKNYNNPISHFNEIVKNMNDDENMMDIYLSNLTKDSNPSFHTKNLGFVCLSRFFHLFRIDYFWNNRQRTSKKEFNLNHIFQTLVFLRALDPGSNRYFNLAKDKYLLDFSFELHDIYRALSVFNTYKNDFIYHLHDQMALIYKKWHIQNNDDTHYYFEMPYGNDFKIKSITENSKLLVQMGILMNAKGIPVSYELFNGNKDGSFSLLNSVDSYKTNFKMNRIVVVYNKGIYCNDNIYHNLTMGNGYIFSQNLEEANDDIKDFIRCDDGYYFLNDDVKIKSRIVPVKIEIVDSNLDKKSLTVRQKEIAFYSKNHVKKKKVNSKSDKGSFDGYNFICTSELDKNDWDIIDKIECLKKIEKSFRTTDTEIITKPTNLSRKDRIEAYFLICFTSLFLLKIMEFKLGGELDLARIIKAMNDIKANFVDENIYELTNFNEDISKLGKLIGVDFSKRYLKKSDLKHIISSVKKV